MSAVAQWDSCIQISHRATGPLGVGLGQLGAVNHHDISWTARSIREEMDEGVEEKAGQDGGRQ